MITVPSYILYQGIHCPIEYLLKKYRHDDIFPIAKPIKLSRNTFVFLLPCSMSDNFIELLQEDELCTIDHIKNEEFVNMNFSNKYIGMKSNWKHNDYVADYFIITEDSTVTSDSMIETIHEST
jgi:3-methyladenine DNA glycosylase AlkD